MLKKSPLDLGDCSAWFLVPFKYQWFPITDQWISKSPTHTSRETHKHTHTDSHTNIPLTLGYFTVLRADQAFLNHQCSRNVPASCASISGVTGATAAQVIKGGDVCASLFHHSNRIVHGIIRVIWRKKLFVSLFFKTRVCDFMSVSGMSVFTCVALASSRDQAVVFACGVGVTPIQSDGISLIVLHNYEKEDKKCRCHNCIIWPSLSAWLLPQT